MLQIKCPWCGDRAESEFRCGGEGHIARPVDPQVSSDEEWADYLYFRENPKGIHFERWLHRFGCQRWFNVARNTVSHEILAIYGMTDPKPAGLVEVPK